MKNCNIIDGVLKKYTGKETHLEIPDTVHTIGEEAFKGNSTLKEIVIPPSVTTIEKNGFQCCYELESIQMPKEMLSIGNGAFNNCPKLKEIILPKGIKEIPDACFFACTSLEKATLSFGIERIGKEAFELCNLGSIVIPDGVKIIDSSAFYYCRNLKNAIIPSSVLKIDYLAFGACKYLATNSLNISDSIDVANDAFAGCCKYGYRTINYSVKCNEFCKNSSRELKDDETLEDVAIEIAAEDLIDEYQDTIDFALEQYSHNPEEGYDLTNIEMTLYSSAKEYVSKEVQGVIVRIKYDDSINEKTIELPLSEVLKYEIDMRADNETACCDVGNVVEASLQTLQVEGSWKIGLINKNQRLDEDSFCPSLSITLDSKLVAEDKSELVPIIWYSTSQKIIPPLYLIAENGKNDMDFWNETDDYYITQTILNADDCFLTWYFPECGRSGLDMDKIKETCPIELSEEITEEEIISKIRSLFNCE